ncbi:hypothetical protein ANCCEY_01117 [Ancylostoma ceylanicum]|uniref:AMP-dependent synthetase/ligase domain-containing protein n=1 Tax=Ancylostoma ceylanicum TaxID=53326 RepID=A0A0D6M8C0_9BILA|nr:hypothetical protein ANCCEY_01117 [Ancylostoma ceylanicum]
MGNAAQDAHYSEVFGRMLIKSDYPPVPIPHSSFPQTVLTALEKHISHNRTAFICAETDKQVTFKSVYHAAYALATFLHEKGFHKEVACAVLPNQWEWAAIFLGVTLNGGVLTTSSAVSTECKYNVIWRALNGRTRTEGRPMTVVMGLVA